MSILTTNKCLHEIRTESFPQHAPTYDTELLILYMLRMRTYYTTNKANNQRCETPYMSSSPPLCTTPFVRKSNKTNSKWTRMYMILTQHKMPSDMVLGLKMTLNTF